MKPFIENVMNTPSHDWIVREYHCRVKREEFACSWHYHTEYELVLYQDPDEVFNGNYFAGDAVGTIGHNTMLLYGPGLPHMITGRMHSSEEKPHHSVIVWLKHQWIEKLQATIPEARNIKRLLDSSAFGVKFSPSVSQQVASKLKEIDQLDRAFQAIRVMEVLLLLASDTESQRLSASPYRISQLSGNQEAHQKVQLASQYIEQNYAQVIRISDLSKKLHMSESSAYRLFEKHYGVSFSEHLKQFRIGKACELLASSTLPVAIVAEKTGFQNLSNFNRLFKTVKEMTPTQFRHQFQNARK
ncbi:transcriptional regulator, AraC family protein [Vibrio sinaloensis DSM 21326]|uniref:Transcriptional regulator, AraC family protein n=1 Tax=Vibrio sinaloensis DSM 21326 TaxID=945550 RepID=E8MAD0_PHOS4|nr:AraC family transcriptional regulator [Vibrio sinaloensis]EGA69079.1 transcriptional regulator, AraC family protein [Vibrio sinaloensis DSM 21326]